MVWIHGGGWSMGSAELYDGSVLSGYGDVVVVVISYRPELLIRFLHAFFIFSKSVHVKNDKM